jgi:hypothetical protein
MTSIDLLGLPDFILLHILSYTETNDLVRVEMVSIRLQNLETEELWKARCNDCWKEFPRYRLTGSRQRWLDEQLKYYSWKARYAWVKQDLSRTTLTKAELESLDWYFNFTPLAGGQGKDTLRRCIFRDGLLLAAGFPPLPYSLVNMGSRKQALAINDFPVHFVERLKSSGEWLIKNSNVTFVSCDEAGSLSYTDRGFQG